VRHILAVGIPSTRREDFIAMQPLHAPHGTPDTILVCGEALMDVLVDADGCQHPTPGGGPFNTARALAGLGVQAAFLGRLSTDAYGQQLTKKLLAAGTRLEFASLGPEPTTTALVRVDAGGGAQYEFRTDGTSASNLTREMLPPELGADVEALHVGTRGLVLEPMATTLVELVLRERGRRPVMVDPNIRAQLISDRAQYLCRLENEVLPASTIVKASEQDLGWLYPDLDLEAACEHILRRGPRLIVATLGADGAFGLTQDVRARVDAPAVDVVDTIGAGDVFGAALLAWLHDCRLLRSELCLDAPSLEAALAFACRAASWTCTRAGAEAPSRHELLNSDRRNDLP
jgi:fructokinase